MENNIDRAIESLVSLSLIINILLYKKIKIESKQKLVIGLIASVLKQ